MPVQRIALIGFSGTGKSLIAKVLARKLGWICLDSDQEISRREGLGIPELFSAIGESDFRRLEAEVLEDLCRQNAAVISTGGGGVLTPASREALARCYLVLLEASPETIFERLSRNTDSLAQRPLLQGDDPLAVIRQMKTQRAPLYAVADLTVNTEDQTPESSVEEIRQGWGHWREQNLLSESRRQRITLAGEPSPNVVARPGEA